MFLESEKVWLIITFLLLFDHQESTATWNRKSSYSNSDVQVTKDFDITKYPVCQATSNPKECNVYFECQNVCTTSDKPNCVTRPKLDCSTIKRKECKNVLDHGCKNRRDSGMLLPEAKTRNRRTVGHLSRYHVKRRKFTNTKRKKASVWGSSMKKPLYGSQGGSKNCVKKVCVWIPYKQSCVNRPVTECSGSTPVQTCKKKCENVYYCTSCPAQVTASTTTTTSTTTIASTTSVPSRPTPPPDVIFTTPSFVATTPKPLPQPPAPPILPLPPIGPPGTTGLLPAGEEVLPPSPPVGPVISPPAPPSTTTKRPVRPTRPSTQRPTKSTTAQPKPPKPSTSRRPQTTTKPSTQRPTTTRTTRRPTTKRTTTRRTTTKKPIEEPSPPAPPPENNVVLPPSPPPSTTESSLPFDIIVIESARKNEKQGNKLSSSRPRKQFGDKLQDYKSQTKDVPR